MDFIIIFCAKYLIWIALALAGYFFLSASPEGKRRLVVLGLVALPLAYVVALAAGKVFYDPRPFVSGGFEPLIPHAADNGFPSDHALLLSAIASVFLFADRKKSVSLWALALVVGAARVLAGVHHPLDIAGSILISLVAAYVADKALALWAKKRGAAGK